MNYSIYKWVDWVIQHITNPYLSLCVAYTILVSVFTLYQIVFWVASLRLMWFHHMDHFNYSILSRKQPLTIGSYQSFSFWEFDLDNHFLSKCLTHPFNISNSYLASHTSAIPSISELTINLMKTKIQWITNLSKLLSCLFLLLVECVFMFCYFYVIVVRRDTSFDWEKRRILQIQKRQVSHTVLSYYFSMHFVVIFSSYSCVGLF